MFTLLHACHYCTFWSFSRLKRDSHHIEVHREAMTAGFGGQLPIVAQEIATVLSPSAVVFEHPARLLASTEQVAGRLHKRRLGVAGTEGTPAANDAPTGRAATFAGRLSGERFYS